MNEDTKLHRYLILYTPMILLAVVSAILHLYLAHIYPEKVFSSVNFFGFLYCLSFGYFANTVFSVSSNYFVRFISVFAIFFATIIVAFDFISIHFYDCRIDLMRFNALFASYKILFSICGIMLVIFSILIVRKTGYVKNNVLKLSLIPVGVTILIVGLNPFPNALISVTNWDRFKILAPRYLSITPELPSFLRLSIKNSTIRIFSNNYFYKNSQFFEYNYQRFKLVCQRVKSEKVDFGNKIFSHGAFDLKYGGGMEQDSFEYIKKALSSDISGIEADIFYLGQTSDIVLSHDWPPKSKKLLRIEDLFDLIKGKKNIHVWLDLKNRGNWDVQPFIKKLKSLKINPMTLQNLYFEHPNPFILHDLSKAGFNTIWSLGYGLPYISLSVEKIRSYISFCGCKAVSCRWECVDRSLEKKLMGFPVFTYTVNNLKVIDKLKRYKYVKAIITDLILGKEK